MWEALAEARARNHKYKAPTANRYSQLLHDLSFTIGYLGTARVHGFITLTLGGGVLPKRAYAMHKRLHSADVLIGPGFYASRFAAARRFYDRLDYTIHVYNTSTDGTATRQQVTVDLKTRHLHGLCTLRTVVAGDTLQEMMEAVTKFGIARVVDVFLLNPLDTLLPSFVLGVFPQQSTPKHEVLVERWDVAHQLLEQNGMGVLAHGGDGDSPQLSAMLTRACTDNIAFGSGRCIFSFPSVPAITGGFLNVSAPARRLDLDGLGRKNVTVPVLHFQDPSHLLLKMRWRITGRGGRGVRLSPQGNASVRLLAYLLENEESVRVELDHGLRKTDLNPKDKMNFPAAERLFSERIIAALDIIPDATAPPPPPPPPPLPPTAPTTQPTAPVPPAAAAPPVPPPTQAPPASQPKRKQRSKKKGSNGDTAPPVESDGQQKHKKPRKKKKAAKEKDTTDKQDSEKKEPLPKVVPPRAQELAAFLRLGRAAVFAFLGRGLSARERLKQAWFARYFADGWRAWLVENGLPLTHEFLSTNQYSCIKLNAESLLLFYHWLCSEPELRKKVPASVFGFGSQQNENLFRDTRAQGNDPNFTVEEFQRRVTLAQEMALIRRTHEGVFVFAKHHKHTASDHIRRPAEYLEEDFSEQMVHNCLMEALSEARALLDALGMKLKKLTSDPVAYAFTQWLCLFC